jgi:hypothetical protein
MGAKNLIKIFSLIGKLVKNQRGPATVNGSNLYNVTVGKMGRHRER